MITQNINGLVGIKVARIQLFNEGVEALVSNGKKYVFRAQPGSTFTCSDFAEAECLLKKDLRTTSVTLSHKAELTQSAMLYTSTLVCEFHEGKIVLEWTLLAREFYDGLVSYTIE